MKINENITLHKNLNEINFLTFKLIFKFEY